MKGNIDFFDRTLIKGWAFDEESGSPIRLAVHIDDQAPLHFLANAYREDLEKAGFGSGRHAFEIELPDLSRFQAHVIQIGQVDGPMLAGSPVVLAAALEFDASFQRHLIQVLGDVDDPDALLSRASFLAQQADRLLQLRAAQRGKTSIAARHFQTRWTGRSFSARSQTRLRALVIDSTLPQDGEITGASAIQSQMSSLQRLGYDLVFAPADMVGGAVVAILATRGIAVCAAPWCGSLEELLRREQRSFDLVCLHRGANAHYLPLIRHYQPRARIVFSALELQQVRLARQAEVEQRPELAELGRHVRNVELSAAQMADRVIVHSKMEAELLRAGLPNARVHVLPVSVLPTPTVLTFDRRNGLAFIGNYRDAADIDAAWWLIQDVMPRVWARDETIECLLEGGEMPDALRAAAARGIRPIGQVAERREVFDQVRLTVAPRTFGAGVDARVLDSLAAGIPCACTPIAAEGLDLSGPLLETVGDGAEALADRVHRLHTDAAFNAACAAAGVRYVVEHLSNARIDALMSEVLG